MINPKVDKKKDKKRFTMLKFFAWVIGGSIFTIFLLLMSVMFVFTTQNDYKPEFEVKLKERSVTLSQLMVSFSPKLHYEALKGDVSIIMEAVECVNSGTACNSNSDFSDISLRAKTFIVVVILSMVKIFMLGQFLFFIGQEIFSLYKGLKNEHQK